MQRELLSRKELHKQISNIRKSQIVTLIRDL